MKRVSQPAPSNRSTSLSGPPAKSSPEKTVTESMLLVLSGGEGYVDFRLGDNEETALEEQGGDLISMLTFKFSSHPKRHYFLPHVLFSTPVVFSLLG